jgi:hypothetical protein
MASLPNKIVDDELVVCITPVEGSVKEEPIAETPLSESSASGDEESVVYRDRRRSTKNIEKVQVGMVCDTKNLYQKLDGHRRFIWTEEYPDGWEEAAENEQTQKYAILVRNSE